MKSTLIAISFLMASFSCFSQVTSTISAGNWNTPGNWSNGVPANGGTATIGHVMTLDKNINVASGNYTVTNAGQIIDPTGGIEYNIDVTLTGFLDVSGEVSIGGDFTIRNSAQFILRGCDTMTVGGDVTFSQTSSATIESCAVLFVEGNVDMSNSNGTTINGNVIVQGNFSSANSSTIIGTGNLLVNGVTDIRNTATIFGSSTGCDPGPCSYGTGGALPIELLTFSAMPLSNTEIEINWETLTELNNDFFTLDYSTDAQNFITIANVKGAGNSQTLKKYRHTFEHELNEVIYIRLTQTDFDGKYQSFDLIGLYPKKTEADRPKSLGILAFPNPTKSGDIDLSVDITGVSESNNSIMIHNINGVLVFQKDYQSDELGNKFKLLHGNSLNLEKGIYFISITDGNLKTTEKLIVL